MQLNSNNELVGTLTDIIHKSQKNILIISTHWDLEIPKNAFSKDKLEQVIGSKIGILNFDGNYKLRIIKK